MLNTHQQHRRHLHGLIISLALVPWLSAPTGIASEPSSLAAMLRQLDLIDRQAETAARRPRDDTSRYHFDYLRLREDLQRMRQGIRDHLSPQRAQPRDPVPLHGDYRQETEVPDEPGS